jgi:hypothetical protein
MELSLSFFLGGTFCLTGCGGEVTGVLELDAISELYNLANQKTILLMVTTVKLKIQQFFYSYLYARQ